MEKNFLRDKRFEIDLLYNVFISFEWLFRCKNEYSSLKAILSNYENEKGGSILNPGILVSFAYWALVFAYESKLLEDNFIISKININDFEIEKDDKNSIKLEKDEIEYKKKLLKRIRNSISHSRFVIIDKYIFLRDGRPQNKDIVIDFEVKILMVKFGDFMNQIFSELNKKIMSLKYQ